MTTKSASLGIGQLLRVLCAHDSEGRTDGQLLERFLVHQDEAAFAALVRRHGPMVFGVCRRILGNDADSEDAFQATFLVLVRRAPSLTSRSVLGDWLHGVARYTALKAKAAATHRQAKEQAMARPDATAEEVRNDWLPLLDEELSRLPEKYRLPIVLCDLEGKTRHEAAEQLGWPEGTVAGRLARARTMLAKGLARHGVVFSGGALAVAVSQNAASACVPGSLLFSTVKAASMSAAGKAVAGVVSTKVAALTEGVLKAMLLTKLKAVTAVLVVLGMVALGGGLLTYHTAPGQEAQTAKSPAEGRKIEAALKSLAGTWELVSSVRNGKNVTLPEQKKIRITIMDNGVYTHYLGDQVTGRGTSKADPTTSPMAIDTVHDEGTLKGETLPGIFELKGNELRMCLAEPGKGRPTKFESTESPPQHLETWKRVSDGLDERPKVDDVTPKGDAGRPIRSLSGHKERVISVAYSPDGRWIATASWDYSARLWDAQTGKEVRRLDVPAPRSHTAHLTQILFSPDNELVVVARQTPNEAGVIVWNRRTGEKVREFPDGHGSVAVSPDGRLIACGGSGKGAEVYSGVVRVYELATGRPVRELHGHQSSIELLAFSPDGKTVIAHVGIPRPRDGRLGLDPLGVRAWDLATGKEEGRRATLNALWKRGPATSPDGRTQAAGPYLSETATGGRRTTLTGYTHDWDVHAVAFAPDGRTLASGSGDGTVRLWDLPSGKEVARFGKEVPKGGWVLSVAFSPDGRTLVSGGLDKMAHIWDVRKITERRRETVDRSPAELETDWKDLGSDAAKGYAAIGRLISSPDQSVSFLGKRFQSVKPPDAKRIEKLISNLDDGRFQVREEASEELEAFGDFVVPMLQKALTGNGSLELKRRLEGLLDRLDRAPLSAETLRQVRAVEALESIGNQEAHRILENLASGPAEIRLTKEASASARRLAKRSTDGQ